LKGKKDRANRTVSDYIDTVKNLQLIIEENGKFSPSIASKKFLETQDNIILYQQLNKNYAGISGVIELLYKQPLTLEEICSSKSTQCKTRLYWLQSLGYVTRDGKVYCLTKEGKSVVEEKKEEIEESTVTFADKRKEHDKIQDTIVELGKVFGLYPEKEYPINGDPLDVVWKRKKDKSPSVAFEIELSRNLRKALSKLMCVWEDHNSKPFLVTPERDKLKSESLVSSSFHDLEGTIEIMTVEEIKKWYELVRESSRIAVRSGFRGTKLWFRKRKTSRQRKRRS
jgi:hypothetical protein